MKSEPKAFASLSSGLLARKGSARPAMRPQGFGQGGSGLEDLGWNDMGFDAQRPALTPVDENFAPPPPISRTPLAGLTPISPVHDQHAELEEHFGGYEAEDEGEGVEQPLALSQPVPLPTSAPVAFEPEAEEPEALELSEEVEDGYAEHELPEAMPVAAFVPPVQAFVPEPVAEVAPPAPKARTRRSPAPRSQASDKGKAAFTLRLDPSRHLKLRLACAVTARSAQQLVTKAVDELLRTMPELEAMAERAPERASRKG